MFRFHTLMYVSEGPEEGVNLRKPTAPRLQMYLKCALAMSRMMAANGDRLTILTNDADRLCALSADLDPADVAQLDFTLDVPEGVPFYSAHYKLEVFRAFGSGAFGARPALCDLDMLALRRVPRDPAPGHDMLVYDITPSMVADVGAERILQDLSLLLQAPVRTPRWFGGEFLAGPAEQFAALSAEITRIWPRYVDNIDTLSHVGDETITTAALLTLEAAGMPLRDAGTAGLVRRWWSARTHFPQAPLAQASDVCFLHVPADKEFLAALPAEQAPGAILDAYRDYVRPKLRKRRIANHVLNLLRSERKHVARLV